MRRLLCLSPTILLALVAAAQQQTQQSALIFSDSYFPDWKSQVNIAPGLVLPIAVHGLRLHLDTVVKAKSYPLPTELSGISVRYSLLDQPLPIFGIRPVSNFLVMSIQIPYEIGFPPPAFAPSPLTFLSVYENGEPAVSITANHILAKPRILTVGDGPEAVFPQWEAGPGSPQFAPRDVQHADGSLVTPINPAQPGEILKLYAYGLGISQFHPLPKSGELSPPGYDMDVGIGFAFGVNPKPGPVPPFSPDGKGAPPTEGLVWAGLAEGMAGVYEVRFRVPTDVPEGTPACGSEVYHTPIRNNLTVNIGYSPSVLAPVYDGAGICVAVPADRVPANRQRGSGCYSPNCFR